MIRKQKILIKWTLDIVKEIRGGKYILFFFLCILLSLLPAIALRYQQIVYRSVISGMDDFNIQTITLVHKIIILCITFLCSGWINRINQNVLREFLYEDINLGMEKKILDLIKKVPIMRFFESKFMDSFYIAKFRYTAYTSFFSDIIILSSLIVEIVSMLFLLHFYSKDIFIFSTVYVFIAIFINAKIAKYTDFDYVKYRESETRAQYYEKSVITSGVAKEIRLYHSEKSMIKEWDRAYYSIRAMEENVGKWKGISEFICGFGYYLFSIIMLFFAVGKVWEKELSVDIFIMIYSLFQNLSLSIKKFSKTLQDYSRDSKDLYRVKNFFDLVPDREYVRIDNGERHIKNNNILEVCGIDFSYPNGKKIINNVSFSIREGETVALLGKNGSGKSTLVKILMGLYKPSIGNIFYRGEDYEIIGNEKIRSLFGVFFQDSSVFHATLKENVGMGNLAQLDDENMIKSAIMKSQFLKAENLDQWLLKDVRNDGIMLSGGEKQKVGIARTYMGNKEIMIFDEPASALDPLAEKKQFEIIKNQLQNNTAILISHRVGFAKMADKIIVMDKGEICEIGTHMELLSNGGLYTQMYNKQMQWYQE